MPVGIDDFQRRPDGLDIYRIGRALQQPPLLPAQQASPFARALLQLRDAGMLPPGYEQAATVQAVQQMAMAPRGQTYLSSTYEPSNMDMTPETRMALQSLHQGATSKEDLTAAYLPKEETGSFLGGAGSGFLHVLEYFGIFNYAISGAINATVNLFQGEETENNPLVEAWRGLTMQDKETFMNVFENLGWDGEQRSSWWPRFAIGLAADIALDPITYMSGGLTGLVKAAGTTFKLGKVAWKTAKASTFGVGVEKGISRGLTSEIISSIQKGKQALVSKAPATSELADSMADLYKTKFGELVDSLGIKSAPTEEVARGIEMQLAQSVHGDVLNVLGNVLRGREVGHVKKLLMDNGGLTDDFFGAIAQDGKFGGEVTKRFAKLAGIEFTEDAILDLMTNAKTIGRFVDQGGMKFRIPIIGKAELVIPSAFKTKAYLAGKKTAMDFYTNITTKLGSRFPEDKAIGGVSRWAEKVAAGTWKVAGKTATGVGKALGFGLRNDDEVKHLNRQFKAQEAQSDVADKFLTRTLLYAKDPKGPIKIKGKRGEKFYAKKRNPNVVKATVAAINSANSTVVRDIAKGAGYLNRKELTARAARLEGVPGAEHLAEDFRRILKKPGSAHTPEELSKIIDAALEEQRKILGLSAAETLEAKGLSEEIEKTFRGLYDDSVRNGIEMSYMDFYLPRMWKNVNTPEKITLAHSKEVASDLDVHTLARQWTPEEAAKQGLEMVTDLEELVYRRLRSYSQAVNSRNYVRELLELRGIHPAQMNDVLANTVVKGSIGMKTIKTINGTREAASLGSIEGAVDAVPEMQEFLDLALKGDLEGAANWVDEKGHFVSEVVAVSEQGAAQTLGDVVNVALQKSVNTAKLHVGKVSERFLEMTEKTRAALKDIGVTLTENQTHTLGKMLEARIVSKIGDSGELWARDLISEFQELGGSRIISAAELGDDVAGLAALDTVIKKSKAVKVPQEVVAKLDTMADEVLEILDGFVPMGKDPSVWTKKAKNTMVRLAARYHFSDVADFKAMKWFDNLVTAGYASQTELLMRKFKRAADKAKVGKTANINMKFKDSFNQHAEAVLRVPMAVHLGELGTLSKEIRGAIKKAAKVTVGGTAHKLDRALGDLDDVIKETLKLGPDANQSDLLSQLDEVMSNVSGSFRSLFEDLEMGPILRESYEALGKKLVEVQTNGDFLVKGASELNDFAKQAIRGDNAWFRDNAGAVDNWIKLLEETDEMLARTAARNLKASSELVNTRAIGPDSQVSNFDEMFKQHKGITKELRGDAQKMSAKREAYEAGRAAKNANAYLLEAEKGLAKAAKKERLYRDKLKVVQEESVALREGFDVYTSAHHEANGLAQRLTETWSNANQTSSAKAFLSAMLYDEFMLAGDYSKAGWEAALRTLREVGPTSERFKGILSPEDASDLFEELSNPAFWDLKAGRGTVPPAITDDSVGIAFKAMTKDPEIMGLLNADGQMLNEVLLAKSRYVSEAQGVDEIAHAIAGEGVPVAELADQWSTIKALDEVVKRRKDNLALTQLVDEQRKLAEVIERKRPSGRAFGSANNIDAMEEASELLQMARGKGKVEDFFERMAELGFDDDAVNLLVQTAQDATAIERKANRLVDDMFEQISKQFDSLVDLKGIKDISSRGGRAVSEEAFSTANLAETLELAPELAPQLGQLLEYVSPILHSTGELEPLAHRAQYWLWQLGKYTEEAKNLSGTLGLPADAQKKMVRTLTDYINSGSGAEAARVASDSSVLKFQNLANEAGQTAKQAQALTREVHIYDSYMTKFADNAKAMNLQYNSKGELNLRASNQFNRYMELFVMSQENQAIHQARKLMPSAADVGMIRNRALATAENIGADQATALRGPGGALEGSAQMQLLVYDELAQAMPKLLSNQSLKIFDFTGIHLEDVLTRDQLLRALSEQGYAGIKQVGQHFRLVQGEVVGGDLSLHSAVTEALWYLDHATEGGGKALGSFPATELQQKVVADLLRDLVPDTTQHGSYLHALSSTHRVDKLTYGEAQLVVNKLQDMSWNMRDSVRLGKSGQIDLDKLHLAAQAKNLLPSKLVNMTDGGAAHFREAAGDLGEKTLVPFSPGESGVLPIFKGLTDKFGREIDFASGRVHLPRYVIDELKNDVFHNPSNKNPLFMGLIKNLLDPMTNSFKWLVTLPIPAFHVRNTIEGSIRAFWGGAIRSWNPKHAKDMYGLVSGRPGTINVKGWGRIDNDVMRGWLQKNGILTEFSEKIGIVADEGLESFYPLSSNYVFRKMGDAKDTLQHIAGDPDNMFRAELFIGGLEQGMSPSGAANHAMKFMFDYATGLSPFERNWMKRLFPFYTFSRFNIPLAVESMWKRPGFISFLGKTQHLFSDDDPGVDALLPGHVRDSWHSQISRDGNKLKILSGSNLLGVEDIGFFGNLAQWRDEGITEGFFMEVMGRLNPMLKLLPELAFDHNFFFNKEIPETQIFGKQMFNLPGVKEWLQHRDVKVGDRIYTQVNGDRWHILQQSHLGRIYRSITQFVDPEDGFQVESFLPFITGCRILSVDLDRRHKYLVSKSNYNRGKIKSALNRGDTQTITDILDTTIRPQEALSRLRDELQQIKQPQPFGL